MKKLLTLTMAFMFVVGFSQMTLAAEHGGKEHGGKTKTQEHGGKSTTQEHGGTSKTQIQSGKEHGGTSAKKPAAADIRSAMKNHIVSNYVNGAFAISDPDTGTTRHLKLVRVHERVGKTGDYYYSCADFRDAKTNELLDLDIDISDNGGRLTVADVRIHKVNGKERYTYDENDNRIPLEVKGSPKEHGGVSKAQEHGGKSHAQEHGGKEHGGS